MNNEERFVLLLDILGFKKMVECKPLSEIAAKVGQILAECETWAPGGERFCFDTIHFSDTLIIYTQEPGFHAEWFDDLVYIGSRVCCAMFADGLPVRGALSYGSFLVQKTGRHQIYLGQALVDAHSAETKGEFLGFKITDQAWHRRYKAHTAPQRIRELGIGIVQTDGSLLTNFFTEFIDHDRPRLAYKIEHFVEYPNESDNPWIPIELQAFHFITDAAKKAEGKTDRVSIKYINTLRFIRELFGERLFDVTDAICSETYPPVHGRG